MDTYMDKNRRDKAVELLLRILLGYPLKKYKEEAMDAEEIEKAKKDMTEVIPERCYDKQILDSLIHDTAMKVKQLRDQHMCEEDIRPFLKKYVQKHLHDLLKCTLSPREENKIVNDLVNAALRSKHEVRNFPEMAKTTSEEIERVENLAKKMVKRTKKLRFKGQCDSDIIEIVRKEIESGVWEIFPDSHSLVDDTKKCKIVKRLLAKSLLSNYNVPNIESTQEFNSLFFSNKKDDDYRRKPKGVKDYAADMFKYLEKTPEFQSKKPEDPEPTGEEEKNKIKQIVQKNLEESEIVAKKIIEFKEQGLVFDFLQENTRYEIKDAMERLLEKRQELLNQDKAKYVKTKQDKVKEEKAKQDKTKIKLDPDREKKLIDQLLINLFGSKLKNEIFKYFESVPELKSVNSKEFFDLELKSEQIEERLQKLRKNLKSDAYIEKMMRYEVDGTISNILKGREEMDLKRKKEKTDQLLTKILGSPYKKIIYNYFESVPELKSKNSMEKLELEDHSELIAQKIEDLKKEGRSDLYVENKTKIEINDVIDIILEKKDIEMETKKKQNLVDELLTKLFSSPVKNKIFKFFERIPELQSRTLDENINIQKMSDRIAKRIIELQDLDVSEAHLQEMMRYEIDGAIKRILEMKEAQIDPRKKVKITDKLLLLLFGPPPPILEEEKPLKRAVGFAKHDMIKNFKANPEFIDLTSREQNKLEELFQEIAVKMEMLRAHCVCDEEVESRICTDIREAMNEMCEMKLVRLTAKRRKKILDNLVDTLMASRHELTNFPELTHATPKEMKKIHTLVEDTKKKILAKRADRKCDTDFIKTLREEMESVLCDIFEKSRVQLDSAKKAKLVDRLLRKAFIATYYPDKRKHGLCAKLSEKRKQLTTKKT